MSGHDQRQPRRHRFGGRHVEPLAAGRQHHGVRGFVEAKQIRFVEVLVDQLDGGYARVVGAQRLDLLRHLVVRVRKRLDDQLDRVIPPESLGEGGEQQIGALPRKTRRDVQKNKGMVRADRRPRALCPALGDLGKARQVDRAADLMHRDRDPGIEQRFLDRRGLGEDAAVLAVEMLDNIARHEALFPNKEAQRQVALRRRLDHRPVLHDRDLGPGRVGGALRHPGQHLALRRRNAAQVLHRIGLELLDPHPAGKRFLEAERETAVDHGQAVAAAEMTGDRKAQIGEHCQFGGIEVALRRKQQRLG